MEETRSGASSRPIRPWSSTAHAAPSATTISPSDQTASRGPGGSGRPRVRLMGPSASSRRQSARPPSTSRARMIGASPIQAARTVSKLASRVSPTSGNSRPRSPVSTRRSPGSTMSSRPAVGLREGSRAQTRSRASSDHDRRPLATSQPLHADQVAPVARSRMLSRRSSGASPGLSGTSGSTATGGPRSSSASQRPSGDRAMSCVWPSARIVRSPVRRSTRRTVVAADGLLGSAKAPAPQTVAATPPPAVIRRRRSVCAIARARAPIS